MRVKKQPKKYTAADLLSHNPCNQWRDRIPAEVPPGGVTARQIAARTDIAICDRRWILTRLLYRADPRELVLWACDCAVTCLERLTGDARDAAECAIQTAVAWTEGAVEADECRYAAYAYAAAYAAAAAAYADAAETTLLWLVLRLESAE